MSRSSSGLLSRVQGAHRGLWWLLLWAWLGNWHPMSDGAVRLLAADPPARPNILWLIGEDLGPELSCYGYPQMRTENLDRLAAAGLKFQWAFSTGPVCSASRSAFMTGMYQTSIGAHHHRSHRSDGFRLPDGVRLITDHLRSAGYYTANIRQVGDQKFGTGKTDLNFSAAQPFDGEQWNELKTHQPFYAQINFAEAHRGPAWPRARQELDRLVDPAQVPLPPYYPDLPLVRDDWANYLDSIHALDRKIGRVLELLAADGLADNTIVCFLGDHGQCHVRGKQWLYDGGIRVPLIVRYPGQIAPGTVRSDLVSLIDLTATTLAWAGLTPPPMMEGRVFWGPQAARPRSYIVAARDRCDETEDRIRCVRTDKFKYIRNYYTERPYTQTNAYKERQYPVLGLMKELHAAGRLDPVQQLFLAPTRPAEELYDLESDPHEIRNLADRPEHQATLVDLRRKLALWMATTQDKGALPELPSAVSK